MISFLICLWLLPVALPIWVCFLWPCQALGLLDRGSDYQGRALFAVKLGKWQIWDWLWATWWGLALPGAALVVLPSLPGDRQREFDTSMRRVAHELRHCDQWETLGVLFPIVYLLLLWRFGYADNPLEVDAVMSEVEHV